MPDTYVVQPNESLWSISKKFNVSFQELKNLNPQLASRRPPYGVSAGDTIKVAKSQQKPKSDVRKPCEGCKNCTVYQLAKAPRLIAIAADPNIKVVFKLTVKDDVLEGRVMPLGQDITSRDDATPIDGKTVGTNEASLKPQMEALLSEFASGDSDKKAKRLFDLFLKKNPMIEVFIDADLDKAVQGHANFISFSERALGAPGWQGSNPPKPRIHQALKAAGWDINKVGVIEGLGVPAFNKGRKVFPTEDFSNGLGVMINGVQYVYIFVESYVYDSCKQEYRIKLKYAMYDVFGLDDDDVREFGSSGLFSRAAGRGITAWWQLQHQFGYKPPLTRAVAYREFVISTAGQ